MHEGIHQICDAVGGQLYINCQELELPDSNLLRLLLMSSVAVLPPQSRRPWEKQTPGNVTTSNRSGLEVYSRLDTDGSGIEPSKSSEK